MIKGRTLHSGVPSEVRLHHDDGAVRFLRNGTYIPARLSNVTATRRSTTLGVRGAQVTLVEHLLAALHVRGWWRDVVVEVSADELPILDGSAAPWLEGIDALGSPPPAPEPLAVTRRVGLELDRTRLQLHPGSPSLDVHIDFDHPAIGRQRWRGTPNRYAEVLNARTFGFIKDLEMLREQGLATHVTTENAMVFDSTGPLTPPRSADEPVRHKALDALGDLFLLGRPLAGRLAVSRGSHYSHIVFARLLSSLAHGDTL